MVHIPELHSLSIVLKETSAYQEWAQQYLEELQGLHAISRNASTLYHHKDTFDSDLFGESFGKVEHVIGEQDLDTQKVVGDFFQQIEYSYCLLRTSQHHTAWIQAFEKHGAIFLDATVELVCDLRNMKKTVDERSTVIQERSSTAHDAQALEVARSFCHGRFFTDPDLKKGFEAYQQWITNSLSGKAADKVFYYLLGEQLHGLMTTKDTSIGKLKGWKVPLMGKHLQSQEKNVATKLLTHVIDRALLEQLDFVLISTQATNIPALRSYIAAGFGVYSSGVTFGWKKGR